MSRLIEMHDVSVTYPGVRALSGVSARFSPGEFVVIVGLSGAGKSTLLRTLNGLVKPTAGDVTLFGESLVSSSPAQLRRLRRDVGMIFQTFHVVKRATVLHNVLAGRVAHTSPWRTFFGLWSRRDVEVAWSCLKRVGVVEKAYVRADRLSGGQQQRVGIARALAQEPKVLLADEPVASLDPRTARAIMRISKRSSRTKASSPSSTCTPSSWRMSLPTASSASGTGGSFSTEGPATWTRRCWPKYTGKTDGTGRTAWARRKPLGCDWKRSWDLRHPVAFHGKAEVTVHMASSSYTQPSTASPLPQLRRLKLLWLVAGLIVAAAYALSARTTEFNLWTIIRDSDLFFQLIREMVPATKSAGSTSSPTTCLDCGDRFCKLRRWRSWDGQWSGLVDSFIVLSSRNISPHPAVYTVAKGLMNLLRTSPTCCTPPFSSPLLASAPCRASWPSRSFRPPSWPS